LCRNLEEVAPYRHTHGEKYEHVSNGLLEIASHETGLGLMVRGFRFGI
jgi:hypothetical protein